MPDTHGGCMLTAPEARPADKPAAGPADRMCTRRAATSWLGRGILLAGLGMIPWAFILASMLPSTTRYVTGA